MNEDALTLGIYDPPEAARILVAGRIESAPRQVTSRTLVRWIHAGLASPRLAEARGREILLTFPDLVSMRVIAALRSAGVSWPAIRDAESWLREFTGAPAPFAREELWTTSGEVFVRFKRMLLAATRHGQRAFDLFEQTLVPINGLSFVAKTAARWEPAPFVLIDPMVQFGEPCVAGTRIPIGSIVASVLGGDRYEFVRDSYDLTDDEMEAALRWGERVAAA